MSATASAPYSHWRTMPCHHCRGYGVVSVYSHNDFEGPGVCPRCLGGGTLFVSPKGRLAAYPGGPFCGSLPKEERKEE